MKLKLCEENKMYLSQEKVELTWLLVAPHEKSEEMGEKNRKNSP